MTASAPSPPRQADIEIILDISRLLSRTLHPRPTGVDRVEMAYAHKLHDRLGDRLQFAAVNPLTRSYGRLDRRAAMAFLEKTERRWDSQVDLSRWALRFSALRDLWRLRPRPVRRPLRGSARYLIQASPSHLENRGRVAARIARERARFVCLVFDLIPIEFPEYARPDGRLKHLARVETMADLADGLVTISATVARSMAPYLPARKSPLVRPILLGVDVPKDIGIPIVPTPPCYFVIISTIEPRKNHLLLLHIWRRMVEENGIGQAPHLFIVGRRGWENENIVDMLERCPAIADHVTELSGLSDEALFPLLSGARALLFPSFAEGFGMPVAEALSVGTPVICSDIPVLHEAGEGIPDYLDPLDGPGWAQAIADYMRPDSPARAAQLDRMRAWRKPTWDAHIDGVLTLIDELDRTPA